MKGMRGTGKIFLHGCALMGVTASIWAQATFLDPTFDPGLGAEGGFVESMALQPDGKVIICGNFTSFGGLPKSYVARLHGNGTVDTNFTAEVGYWVRTVALQTDGKIIVGGFFNTVGNESRNCVARLNTDGSLDTTFDPGNGCTGKIVSGDPNDPFVFASAVQSDGKVIIGGNFTTFNGTPRSGLARLNTNGTLDTTFVVGSGANSWVRSLLLRTNGQIYVSGWFTTFDNQACNRMVLLNANGSIEPGFAPYFGDQTAIYTMAERADARLIVAGHSINPGAPFRQEIVRLKTDGAFDPEFNPLGSGANEKVESVLLQPDGKIVLAGYFNFYNDTEVQGLARLHADGSLDRSLVSTTDNWIWTLLRQPDGRILFCGGFSNIDGFPRHGVARLLQNPALLLSNPQHDGTTFSVSVVTLSGKNYALQYKTSLTGNWFTLPSVPGDGTIKSLVDSEAAPGPRFYRVVQVEE